MINYDIKETLAKALQNHSSTFKETSYDITNNTYLCEDRETQPVFDFDAYVSYQYPQKKLPYTKEKPASPDAIYLGKENIYFVEFKNQKPGDINKTNVRNKFEKGTKMLQQLINEKSKDNYKFNFCVVYKNPVANNLGSQRIAASIKSTRARYGLDSLNQELDNFYDNIITRELDYYKNRFKQLKCK